MNAFVLILIIYLNGSVSYSGKVAVYSSDESCRAAGEKWIGTWTKGTQRDFFCVGAENKDSVISTP